MLGAHAPLPRGPSLLIGQHENHWRAIAEALQRASRIAARHRLANVESGRASGSRLLGDAAPLDRFTHRLNVDAERRQSARCLHILSQRRKEIAHPEL